MAVGSSWLMWLRRIAAGVGLLVVALLVWGVAVEPRLIDVRREAAPLPDLPRAWAGQQIAVIADLQVGMWLANTGTAERIVERIVEARPAAALLAGDFIYQPNDENIDEQLRTVSDILRPLTAAGIPTFAVLGNHDYSLHVRESTKREQYARATTAALERLGIRVLANEAVQLGAAGTAPLHLVGLGSAWASNDDPAVALDAVPAGAARLVFMHNPSTFAELPAGAAPLAIAAHTHGGQIRIPFTPSATWLNIVAEREIHADGWVRDETFGATGNHLYINRGIGFSTVPIRINCRPELTLFELQPMERERREVAER